MAALAPGAALPVASLLLLEIPHLPKLCLPARTPPACIPPVCYLIHLAPSPNAALPPNPRLQTSYTPSTFLYLLHLHLSHYLMLLAVFPFFLLSFFPNSLRALQWNAGGFRSRSTEKLHFISFHLVYLVRIQKSNLNSSSSFRIPGFSALRSDCTHFRCGIFSPNATYASGGVIIFVKQSLSFPKLSTSSLSLLDPNFDYVEINISLNNSSSLSFLNVYSPPICCFSTDSKTDSFCPSILSPFRNLFILVDFNCHYPLWGSKDTFDSMGRKHSIGSFPLTSFVSMTLTYLYSSSLLLWQSLLAWRHLRSLLYRSVLLLEGALELGF